MKVTHTKDKGMHFDEEEKCSLCDKPSPHPPHPLESHTVFTLTLYLCPRCHTTLRRTSLELLNGLRKIRGLTPITWPESEWM